MGNIFPGLSSKQKPPQCARHKTFSIYGWFGGKPATGCGYDEFAAGTGAPAVGPGIPWNVGGGDGSGTLKVCGTIQSAW